MKVMDEPYEVKPRRTVRKMKRVGYIGSVELLNKRTGELKDSPAFITEPVIVDATKFVKLYDPYILRYLSSAGIVVFCYVADKVSFEGDVDVDVNRLRSVTGIGRTTAWKGIRDLLAKDVIRRTSTDRYSVNPNILGRGERKISGAE